MTPAINSLGAALGNGSAWSYAPLFLAIVGAINFKSYPALVAPGTNFLK
jgi:hypothetical protein